MPLRSDLNWNEERTHSIYIWVIYRRATQHTVSSIGIYSNNKQTFVRSDNRTSILFSLPFTHVCSNARDRRRQARRRRQPKRKKTEREKPHSRMSRRRHFDGFIPGDGETTKARTRTPADKRCTEAPFVVFCSTFSVRFDSYRLEFVFPTFRLFYIEMFGACVNVCVLWIRMQPAATANARP